MNKYKHLTEAERIKIYEWRGKEISIAECARRLGRNKSTLSRELKRNATEVGYLPDYARNRYKERRKKCHPKRKMDNRELRKIVLILLEKGWTPEIIEGWLRKKYGKTIVNHETLYKFIYDSELGKQHKLYEYLPRGKRKRTRRCGRKTKKSPVRNRIFIEMRGKEANDRSEIGHWETDSVLFGHRHAINTSADRMSRFTVLTKLPSRNSLATKNALCKKLSGLPVHSITSDNGPENALHEKVSAIFKAPFFFCHPYHSWEKGTIENRNGIVRRYLPRGTNLDEVSQSELDDIAFEINNRPMKCLNFSTPREVLLANSVALGN
jgi:IS30 family transposase